MGFFRILVSYDIVDAQRRISYSRRHEKIVSPVSFPVLFRYYDFFVIIIIIIIITIIIIIIIIILIIYYLFYIFVLFFYLLVFFWESTPCFLYQSHSFTNISEVH